jgi:predicted nuclease of predicted toxin-antitoxin system
VKLLLDAMMPEEIKQLLGDHEVVHVAEVGWRHLSNGELLSAGEREGFDALVTKDANIPHQQNMKNRRIRLVVVRPRSQDLEDLLALAPEIDRSLRDIAPGGVVRVS